MKCIKLRIWCISRIECWQMLKKETLFEIGKVSCAVRQKFEQKWKSFELLTCSFRNVSWNIRIPLFFASHQSDLLAFFVSLYWPSISRCCIKKGVSSILLVSLTVLPTIIFEGKWEVLVECKICWFDNVTGSVRTYFAKLQLKGWQHWLHLKSRLLKNGKKCC